MNANSNTATLNHLSYVAYLVRLWQDTPNGPWRTSAQSVQTGEIVRFGSLQALFEFLKEQTVDSSQVNAPQTCDLQ